MYVSFKKRYDLTAHIEEAAVAGKLEVVANFSIERSQSMGGIVLPDVSGHHATDVTRHADAGLQDHIAPGWNNGAARRRVTSIAIPK
jgi:hypothetical protein